MSYYNPYFSFPPEDSPSSRSPESLAPYTTHRQENRLQILTTPLNPNPNLNPHSSCRLGAHNSCCRVHASTPSLTIQPNYLVLPPAPPLPPSGPLSTSYLPGGCFEEFVIPPPYKKQTKADLEKWGGPIDFAPIQLPTNKGTLGTPMLDCLQGYGLKDPDQRVLTLWAAAGKKHINFMIRWPGYPQLDWLVPISIYGDDSRLVTKKELAHRIATQYHQFTMMCDQNRFQCQAPRWRVGTGGYTLDRMRLSVLNWVEGDIWQAYVRVLTDRDVDPNGLKPMRDLLQG